MIYTDLIHWLCNGQKINHQYFRKALFQPPDILLDLQLSRIICIYLAEPIHLVSRVGKSQWLTGFWFILGCCVGSLFNDMYSYSVSSSTWTQLFVNPSATPSARSNFGFSSGAGKLYLYGGLSSNGTYFQVTYWMDDTYLILYSTPS